MSTGNTRFLELDEQAERLVAELSALRDATHAYATAERDLSKTEDSLRSLADNVAAVTGKIGGCVDAMREIGTPQLLAQHAALGDELRAGRDELQQMLVAMQALVAGIDTRLADAEPKLDALRDNVASGAQQHAAGLTDVARALGETSQQADERHRDLTAQMSAVADGAVADIRTTLGEVAAKIEASVSSATANTESKLDIGADRVITSFDSVNVRIAALQSFAKWGIVGVVLADLVLMALIVLL